MAHSESAAVAVLHDEPGLDGGDAPCGPALPLIPPGPVQGVALHATLPEANPSGATRATGDMRCGRLWLGACLACRPLHLPVPQCGFHHRRLTTHLQMSHGAEEDPY